MNKEWVHRDLVLADGKYRSRYRVKCSNARKRRRRSVSKNLKLYYTVFFSAALTFIITVPLLKIKANNLSTPEIVSESLPDQIRIYAAAINNDRFFSGMTRFQEREFKAQVHYIAEIIETTRNKNLDPYALAFLIVHESRKAQYDPLFVASIILQESSFRKKARSSIGALGLMQIRPSTGKYIAKTKSVQWKGASSLTNPIDNIKLGILYIKYLKEKYSGDIHRTLIAYNWGPGNMSSALKGYKTVPSSCIHYSKSIQRNHKKWKNDFEDKLPAYQHLPLTINGNNA